VSRIDTVIAAVTRGPGAPPPRLEEPVPGLVSLSSYPTEDASAVYLTGYLFSAAAPGYVEREQPTWQAWLEEVAADVASTKPG
jgi:hypothetical protein